MLEFARQQWLWLFVLAALWWLAWLLARRFRPVRVTHAALWQRVAARVLPPAWKRLLRTLLTWLVALALLSSMVLFASGLQRPQADRQAPLMIAIVLDNSVSMSARHGAVTRAELAQRRAQEIVDAMGPDDRALVTTWAEGQPIMGRWLKRGEGVGDVPAIDFTAPDLPALRARLAGLEPAPGVAPVPAPQPLVLWITDFPPEFSALSLTPARLAGFGLLHDFGWPARLETVGAPADNDALVGLELVPAQSEDGHAGILRARTLSGGPANLEWRAGEQTGREQGVQFNLPVTREPLAVRVFVPADALALDNEIRFERTRRAIADVYVAYPDTDTEANPFLIDALREFLPGREVRSGPASAAARCDLLVMDRALAEVDCHFMLCFGVVPPALGQVAAPVRVDPNLQPNVESPPDLGFTVPKLAMLVAREAWPLAAGHALTPLAMAASGQALVALNERLLYCGFVPHQSTLLQDREGLLLLLRWLQSVQVESESPLPPAISMKAETEIRLLPGSYSLRGPQQFTLRTAADGGCKLGPFSKPGLYALHDARGTQIGATTVLLHDPAEQGLPWKSLLVTDLAALTPALAEPDWRDQMPGLLLYIALALLVLEWLAWLLGLTE